MTERDIDPKYSQFHLDTCAFDPTHSPEDLAAIEIWNLYEAGTLNVILAHSNQREIGHPNTPPRVKAQASAMISTIPVQLTPQETARRAALTANAAAALVCRTPVYLSTQRARRRATRARTAASAARATARTGCVTPARRSACRPATSVSTTSSAAAEHAPKRTAPPLGCASSRRRPAPATARPLARCAVITSTAPTCRSVVASAAVALVSPSHPPACSCASRRAAATRPVRSVSRTPIAAAPRLCPTATRR